MAKTVREAMTDEEILAHLRDLFPHGHPKFIPDTIEEMALHSRKNHDYARGGSPLGNFERRAAFYRRYPGLDLGNPVVVALVDAMKQFDAALWMLSQKYEGAVEGIGARLGDVSVYTKLARILNEEQNGEPHGAECCQSPGCEHAPIPLDFMEAVIPQPTGAGYRDGFGDE